MNQTSALSERYQQGGRSMAGGRAVVARALRNRAVFMDELESRMLLTAGVASQLFVGLQPSTGVVKVSNGFALEVEVHDSLGNIVNADTSKLTISVATGPGKLSGTLSVKAVAGVADFTHFLFSEAGTYTLTVSDPGLTSATTGPIVITAAPKATTLVFVQEPTANATGAAVTPAVTVKVLDQFGNLFTTPTQVSLKLLTGPVKGKVSGTLHAKTVAGVATFSGLTVNSGGTFVLQAKEQALTVNSTSFAMGGPPVASTLVFDQGPTGVVAGVDIAPAVTVEVDDQYGHLLVTDHSTIKLTVATGPATNQTFSAPVKNGIATFDKVELTAAGTYTLQAADGALPTMDSGSFVVRAGAAVGLAFTQIPANGALAASPGNIKVAVVDKFGNVVLTDTSTITLATLVSPVGAAPLSTSVQATAGVSTFSGVVLPVAGKYVLKASDDLLVSVVTKPITLD